MRIALNVFLFFVNDLDVGFMIIKSVYSAVIISDFLNSIVYIFVHIFAAEKKVQVAFCWLSKLALFAIV